jgi:hypothetical protein
MPNPLPRLAISRPMEPSPTMPSRELARVVPSRFGHSPRLDLRRQRHRQAANEDGDDDQHDRQFDQGEATDVIHGLASSEVVFSGLVRST